MHCNSYYHDNGSMALCNCPLVNIASTARNELDKYTVYFDSGGVGEGGEMDRKRQREERETEEGRRRGGGKEGERGERERREGGRERREGGRERRERGGKERERGEEGSEALLREAPTTEGGNFHRQEEGKKEGCDTGPRN